MKRVLNASRYAGFDISKLLDGGDIGNELEFREFLEREIAKEKTAAHKNRNRRGEELFNLILEFSKRYRKDAGLSTGRGQAGSVKKEFDILEKIFSIAEKYLEPIESRSATAIVTYLRARKMH